MRKQKRTDHAGMSTGKGARQAQSYNTAAWQAWWTASKKKLGINQKHTTDIWPQIHGATVNAALIALYRPKGADESDVPPGVNIRQETKLRHQGRGTNESGCAHEKGRYMLFTYNRA